MGFKRLKMLGTKYCFVGNKRGWVARLRGVASRNPECFIISTTLIVVAYKEKQVPVSMVVLETAVPYMSWRMFHFDNSETYSIRNIFVTSSTTLYSTRAPWLIHIRSSVCTLQKFINQSKYSDQITCIYYMYTTFDRTRYALKPWNHAATEYYYVPY